MSTETKSLEVRDCYRETGKKLKGQFKRCQKDPLEVKSNQIVTDQENPPELTEETPIRLKHTAAIVAKELFKVIDLFENEDME